MITNIVKAESNRESLLLKIAEAHPILSKYNQVEGRIELVQVMPRRSLYSPNIQNFF